MHSELDTIFGNVNLILLVYLFNLNKCRSNNNIINLFTNNRPNSKGITQNIVALIHFMIICD